MSITNPILENKTIIINSIQPWHFPIGSNCKDIAIELSKKNKVFYINYPVDRFSLLQRFEFAFFKKNLKREFDSHQITENLIVIDTNVIWESCNWIPVSFLFKIVYRYNIYKINKRLESIFSTLQISNFIHFNDNDIFRTNLEHFRNRIELDIFYIRDFLLHQSYFKKYGKALEAKNMQSSNIVCANSDYLKDYAIRYNPNSFFIGQGIDFSIFKESYSEKEIPFIFKKYDKKYIGYVGSLTGLRLDIKLIHHIANKFQDAIILLVGPEDIIFKESTLHKQKNIVFIGKIDQSLLGNYINCIDVCINPQLENDLTIGNYPRKIDEYLYFGKPTVATKTHAMKMFNEVVYLADSYDEFVKKISLALIENNIVLQNKRIEFAKSHTWEESIKNMEKGINLFLDSSGKLDC